MIARLKGIIDYIDKDNVIIDINGVGYQVFCSASTISSLQIGKEVVFDIITVVKEDSFTLYGFANVLDKQWFEILTSVQGVGAKVGLAIQSVHTSDSLFTAVASSDSSAFTQANGVGPKLANRIVLELKDKVAKTNFAQNSTTRPEPNVINIDNSSVNNSVVEDTISALINLGYNRSNAFTAVGKVVKNMNGEEVSVADIVPLALNELS